MMKRQKASQGNPNKGSLSSQLWDKVWLLFLTAFILFVVYEIIKLFIQPSSGTTSTTVQPSLELFLHNFAIDGVGFAATAMLSVVIARLFFGLRPTKDYFSNVFSKSVADLIDKKLEQEAFINQLPAATLEKLHFEIVKKTADIDFDYDSSFYWTMRHKIEPLLGKTHINRCVITINNKIEPYEHGFYIERDKVLEFEYHLKGIKDKALIGFNYLNLQPIEGFDAHDLYSLNMFVDGKRKSNWRYLRGPKILKNGLIRYRYPVRLKIKSKNNNTVLHVRREEKLILPLSDSTRWTIPIGSSLRELSVSCSFNKPVHPELYVFGIERGRDLDGEYVPKAPDNSEYSCSISNWKGWMLPYHGIFIRWNTNID